MFEFLTNKQHSLAAAVQRRLHPRQRTRLRPAKIASLDYQFLCDCTIRDMSHGGVRIVLNHQAELPEEFYLFDVGPRTIAEVQLRWRDGLDAGVIYLLPPAELRHFSNSGIRKLAQRLYAMDG
ncbi:MAG: PilZ domain-containing protein [Roseibium sp.]